MRLPQAASFYYGGLYKYYAPSVALRSTAPVFFGNLFFLQSVVSPVFGSNGPLWSLSYEFWYYILFPALMLAAASWLGLRARLVYLGLAVLLAWFVGAQISLYFLIWLMGMLIGRLRNPAWPDSSRMTALVCVAASLPFVLALAWVRAHPSASEIITDFGIGVCFAFWLYILIQGKRQDVSRVYERAAAKKLAGFSYTLYLTHFPALAAAACRAGPSGKLAARWETSSLWTRNRTGGASVRISCRGMHGGSHRDGPAPVDAAVGAAGQRGRAVMLPAMLSNGSAASEGVPDKKIVQRRLLLVCSHVVQYASPIFRKMAQDPRFEILVAYCSMQGAESGMDPGFGVEVTWDEPQLDGYRWTHPPNRAMRPGVDRFFGLFNPGLWGLIRKGGFDAMYVSGYFYASAWIAILACKWTGVPIIFTTDGHNLRTWSTQSRWKQRFKKFLVRRKIYSLGHVVLAGSSGTVEYLKSLGVPPDRILLSRNVVDNQWWMSRAMQVNRDSVRASWSIPASATVALFCAKLQPWKAPQDLLEAFAKASVPNSFLVFAGDGPLRTAIEGRARELGISDRVRILGFVNQSQLASIYRAADLFVLPSLYEPFGLVVNEAMLCGCPVAVSDRVGAKYDLVREGENGYVFPTGNVEALAAIYRDFLPDPEKRKRMGEAARQRMETWSPREYVDAMSEAVDRAARSKGRGAQKRHAGLTFPESLCVS